MSGLKKGPCWNWLNVHRMEMFLETLNKSSKTPPLNKIPIQLYLYKIAFLKTRAMSNIYLPNLAEL